MDSNLEEALLQFRELIPRMYWNLYQGLLQVGFDEHQAFTLLQCRVLGEAAGKIQPPSGQGPNTDIPES